MPHPTNGPDEPGSSREPEPGVTMEEIAAPELPEAEWLAIFARAADVVASGGGEELDDLVTEPVAVIGDADALDPDHLDGVIFSEEPFHDLAGADHGSWDAAETDGPAPDVGDVDEL